MNIVVGVTGGIAAYKSVQLVRLLVKQGFDVHVLPTEAALQFVGRPTWEAMSRNPVRTGLYDATDTVPHVSYGQNADLIVIAPATAHTLAKLATGLADDLLGNTVLASTAPVIVAPAMHTEMWLNAATVANVATLRSRGVSVIGPASGQLTGDDVGPGRMVEPEELFAAILEKLGRDGSVTSAGDTRAASAASLAGKHVLVSAGGTREAIDPVRFVGNRSTGKQGLAFAEAALERGASVTVVAANLEVPATAGVTVVPVNSAEELSERMRALAPAADLIIMAAAVADFRPVETADGKIKKDKVGDRLTLELIANPDILVQLSELVRPEQTLIGFAAETEPDPVARLEIGRAKLARKGADYLALNRVGWHEGFATDTNDVTLLARGGDVILQSQGSKLSVAAAILDVVAG